MDKPAGLLTQPNLDRERERCSSAGRYLTRIRGVNRPYVGLVHARPIHPGVILLVCSPEPLAVQALFGLIRLSHRMPREGVISRAWHDGPLVRLRGRSPGRHVQRTTAKNDHDLSGIEQYGGMAAQVIAV